MGIGYEELKCKEVICLCDGRRLGCISDIRIEIPRGEICALVVPGPCRYLGIWGRQDDYVIPWGAVKKIGPDIILVEGDPQSYRVCRQKSRCFFQNP